MINAVIKKHGRQSLLILPGDSMRGLVLEGIL
jgi:hypothetical protein